MNEKLLILYLKRLLGGLFDEIHKADEALGPDVDRVEIKRYELASEEVNTISRSLDELGFMQPKVDIQAAEPVSGIANVLSSLEDFAYCLKNDIDDLRGEK